MKIPNHSSNHFRRLGFCAALFLCAFSAKANPISIPEKSVTPEISFLIFFSILLEALCLLFLLRRFRKPRFFIFWIFGMHLLTYPGFLSVLWLLQDMRPAFAAAIGEGLVVLVEGALIYLICRYLPPKQNFPTASLFKCWLVSLVGNACSLVAFPLLIHLYDLVSHSRI
jgi:hypothetical protein